MIQEASIELATFDDQLLDGLNFCQKVYAFFDQIRVEPRGVEKLRLLETKREKRLIEELIPLARYIQMRYREGRRIEVRWLSGSQPYDAILLSSGVLVERGLAQREVVAEITTSVHSNDHLVRQLLNEGKPVFGVKGISRDTKTGVISTAPYVSTNGEMEGDLAEQVINRIKDKASKGYAPNTVLIINCIPNGLPLQEDWDAAMARVSQVNVHQVFVEVFIVNCRDSYSTTLYGR